MAGYTTVNLTFETKGYWRIAYASIDDLEPTALCSVINALIEESPALAKEFEQLAASALAALVMFMHRYHKDVD